MATAVSTPADHASGTSLAERPGDWLFVVFFAAFAFTSFFSDAFAALGLLDGDGFWARANRWYGEVCDPYFLSAPINVEVQTFVSAFVFGPFYLVLVWAFVKGWNRIRIPAIVYVSAMVYGMIVYLGSQFFGPLPPTNVPVFLAFNLPYLLVPLALGWRMRAERPFG